jgi:hypothetical protein
MRKFGKFILASVALVASVGMPSDLLADHGNKGSSHHGGSSHYSPGGGFGQVWSSISYPSSSNCSSSRYPSGPYYPSSSSCSQYPQYPQSYPQQYPQPYPQYPQGSPSYPQTPIPYPPQYPQYPSQPMPPSYPTSQQMPPSGPWGQPTGVSTAGSPWGQPSGTWGGYGGQGPVITAARP